MFSYLLLCILSVSTLAGAEVRQIQPKKTRWWSEAAGHALGPMTLLRRLMERRFQGKGRKEALEETVTQDYPYLVGYVSIAFSLEGIKRALFAIPFRKFDRQTGGRPNNTDQTLYLISFPNGDPWNAIMSERHIKDPSSGSTYRTFDNMDDLGEVLKQLPRDSFDRIEIAFHGHPGKGVLRNGSKVGPSDFKKLFDLEVDFAKRGAELKIISCSACANPPFSKKGDEFQREISRALLQSGGTSYGATKTIQKAIPWQIAAGLLFGVHNLVRVVHDIVPELWRNYRHASQGIVKMEFPPRGTGCDTSAQKIAK